MEVRTKLNVSVALVVFALVSMLLTGRWWLGLSVTETSECSTRSG